MGANVCEITDNNFATEVLQASEPVLVDFWAPWCGPCRMVGPILDDLSVDMDGKATIAKVNVDNDPDIAARYQIRGIPTVILFKDGQLVNQAVGARSRSDYEQMVRAGL